MRIGDEFWKGGRGGTDGIEKDFGQWEIYSRILSFFHLFHLFHLFHQQKKESRMKNPIALMEAHQKRVDGMNGELDIGSNGTSLDLLRAIYRSPAMPLHTRMRAAFACLKHEHPSLGITFQTTSETDFARLLDQRIAHMEQLKMIDHQPPTPAEVKPPMSIAERKLRRI